MKKSLIIIGMCILMMNCLAMAGSDYYFNSTTGSDSNTCLSSSQACKTMTKLQTFMAIATKNSTFYMNSDPLPFRGSLNEGANNQTFRSYVNPYKIWGSINLSATGNWTDIGGSIYESAAVFNNDPFQVYYNSNTNSTLSKRDTSGTVNENWEFYWNSTSSKVKVYLSTGNPATVGNGIEIPYYNMSTMGALISMPSDDLVKWYDGEISYSRNISMYISSSTNTIVQNMSFKYAYSKGIYASSSDNTIIRNNSFYRCGIKGEEAPYGQDAQGENIFITTSDDVIISNNVIELCGGVCINPWHSNNITITGNKVFNSIHSSTDWSAAIYYDGCNNSVASYNNVSDGQIGLEVGNEIAGWYSSNIIFHHNIAYNNKISDMATSAATGNVTRINITQNTFSKPINYGGSGWGNQVFLGDYINISFTNNIVYNNYTNTTDGVLIYAENSSVGANYTGDYNLFFSVNRNNFTFQSTTYPNISGWRTRTGQDTNSITNNPNFLTGTYQPIIGSAVCTSSSNGSYIGAVPCTSSSDTTPPNVSIISPPNGTTTSNNTISVIFNYTDSDSTTSNCTLYISPDVDGVIWEVSNSGADVNYTVDNGCLFNSLLSLRLHDNCQIPENDVMECLNSSGSWVWLGNNTGFDNSRLNEDAVHWLINDNYCYQESANVSDQTGIDGNCSLSYNGNYDLSNFVTPNKIIDGYWGTFTQPLACANPYAYFNYSFPRQEVNNASVINNTNTNILSDVLSDGNYTAYLSCVDSSGNIGNSSLFYFLIDTSTPFINITNPLNGSSVNSNDLNITFSIVHNTSELSFDYYNISLLNSDFSFNKKIIENNSLNLSYVWSDIFTNLSIGTYIIFIEGINSTGDTVLSGNSTFYLTSNSILNITVINYADNTSINTFSINITDETTGTTTSYNTTTGNITLGVINPRNYTITTYADVNHSIDTTEINVTGNTYNLTVTLYDYNALYINYYHELNMSLADGITIYHDIISDAYSNNYTTSNGTLTITGLPAGDYISRYYAAGFVERFFSFTITDYASQVSNLYLASNLTSVLITVRYTNYVPIEGATVKAQKFIVATNSYIDVESGSTDSEGQLIMSLTLNDEYYRFIVTIDGETALTTEKAYIIDNEINLFIITGTTAGDNYFDYRSIDYNLYFDYSTNQFWCIFNDASNSVNDYCLRVLFNNGTFDSDCTTASAGNLYVNITPINGSSYRGSCEVKLEGDWITLRSITVDFDDIANFSREGLLLQVIISLIFILAVIKWPEFIPVSLSLSLLLGRAMQINILSYEVLGGILLTAIIISSWLGRQSR